MKASGILKSSDEDLVEFQKIMVDLIHYALTEKDDPFDVEGAIKYPKEVWDGPITEKLKNAKEFMTKNGMSIEQMFFCPTGDDRKPKFRGLYPEVQFEFYCKDKNGESW